MAPKRAATFTITVKADELTGIYWCKVKFQDTIPKPQHSRTLRLIPFDMPGTNDARSILRAAAGALISAAEVGY